MLICLSSGLLALEALASVEVKASNETQVTTDHIGGPDKLGYRSAAAALALALHRSKGAVVFGNYGVWGSGKSFLQNLVIKVGICLLLACATSTIG